MGNVNRKAPGGGEIRGAGTRGRGRQAPSGVRDGVQRKVHFSVSGWLPLKGVNWGSQIAIGPVAPAGSPFGDNRIPGA